MRMAHGNRMLKPQAITRVTKLFLGCYDIEKTTEGGVVSDRPDWAATRIHLFRQHAPRAIGPGVAEKALEQLENET